MAVPWRWWRRKSRRTAGPATTHWSGEVLVLACVISLPSSLVHSLAALLGGAMLVVSGRRAAERRQSQPSPGSQQGAAVSVRWPSRTGEFYLKLRVACACKPTSIFLCRLRHDHEGALKDIAALRDALSNSERHITQCVHVASSLLSAPLSLLVRGMPVRAGLAGGVGPNLTAWFLAVDQAGGGESCCTRPRAAGDVSSRPNGGPLQLHCRPVHPGDSGRAEHAVRD